MARLPYPDPNTLSSEARDLLLRLKSVHLFEMVAHAEPALRPFVQLGSALLFKGRLDPRLRELAILRVGHLAQAPYEVFQHESIARDVGVDAARIEGVHAGSAAPVFDLGERTVLQYTEELVRDVRPADATFAALRALLGAREIVELTLTVGYYLMVSRVLEALQVDPEGEPKLSGLPRGRGAEAGAS